jgi:hypothetical protein
MLLRVEETEEDLKKLINFDEPQQKQIKVEKIMNKPLLLFEIEDHGIGISEEVISSLFSPFKQAQRLAGGTGLGLFSLAKRVEALDGMCGARRRKDGENGSVFWFWIPYDPVHEPNLYENSSSIRISKTSVNFEYNAPVEINNSNNDENNSVRFKSSWFHKIENENNSNNKNNKYNNNNNNNYNDKDNNSNNNIHYDKRLLNNHSSNNRKNSSTGIQFSLQHNKENLEHKNNKTFTELINRLKPGLLAFAYKYVKDRDTSQEVVQQTFQKH